MVSVKAVSCHLCFLMFTSMDGLSDILCRTETGCAIGSIMTNHFMYADDLVILSPSAKGLQQLIDICADYGEMHDIIFNHADCMDVYACKT